MNDTDALLEQLAVASVMRHAAYLIRELRAELERLRPVARELAEALRRKDPGCPCERCDGLVQALARYDGLVGNDA